METCEGGGDDLRDSPGRVRGALDGLAGLYGLLILVLNVPAFSCYLGGVITDDEPTRVSWGSYPWGGVRGMLDPGVVPPALRDLICVDEVVLAADEPGGYCGFCSLSG